MGGLFGLSEFSNDGAALPRVGRGFGNVAAH